MVTENKNCLTSNSEWIITRKGTLSDTEKHEDARIIGAVITKVAHMQERGIPIARYNVKTDKAFLEFSKKISNAHS